MSRHEKYMRIAVGTASQGIQNGQTPFGACIVKDNSVIAASHNSVWEDTDITAHAEINAIRRACSELKTVSLDGATIYSTCEPCPMCLAACHWAKIETVVYGASIEDAENFGFSELTISADKMVELGKANMNIISGVIREQCLQLFENWSSRTDKKTY
jgi:tRNA(Arg) A34 adenosine deaminase TadA